MIVPFVETVGIEGEYLENSKKVQNHLGSIHAGAQFTLAETASGRYLSSLFAEQKEGVIALLRESSIKYKKQAFGILKSEASVEEASICQFVKNLEIKNHATILVNVKLIDEVGDETCRGSFKWFIQKVKQSID